MKIRLTPPQPDSPTFEVDHQIALALASLHHASIKIRGKSIGRDTATILLARDADSGKALETLGDKGIYGRLEADTQIRSGKGEGHDKAGYERPSNTSSETFLPWINLETRKKLFPQCQSAAALRGKHVNYK